MQSLCLGVIAVTTLWVCYSDIRFRRISNQAVAVTALTSVLASFGMTLSWFAWPVACFVGCLLFAFNIFAGGDIKLALAFLLGIHTTWWPTFIFLTAIGGGLLAACYMIPALVTRQMPALRERGIPYGAPIALAGTLCVWLTVAG